MTLPGKRIFIQCTYCGHEMVFHKKHREALGKRLRKSEAGLTGEDVRTAAKLFRCKSCGSRGVSVREVERQPPRILYVAGGRTESEIFHKDSCGWVGHVHKADIIEFESREAAVMSGYKPCRVCRP
jgi:DNA-directed RNA polymerase subunit RPC12/RpoP